MTPPFTVERVWSALQGSVRPLVTTEPGSRQLALATTIGLPSTSQPSLVSLIKPLIDGIISALHVHDGSKLDLVAKRLSERLDATPAVPAERLTNRAAAVLGERTLLRPFQNSVQWNPADDRLVYIRVLNNSSRMMSGQVLARMA